MSEQQRIFILRDRAAMFAKARQFFAERNILEVDCSIMSPYASVDAHIDLVKAHGCFLDTHYLHSSPEYGMKQLLSQDIGDIYQLSHVFRDEPYSSRHMVEFTMAEWYRLGFSFQQMIEETLAFMRLFLGELPAVSSSYRHAFKQYAGIDPSTATESELFDFLQKNKIETYQNIEEEGKDALLNLIFGIMIQPKLGKSELFVLQDFPVSQAMLAQAKEQEGELVAERFEIFYQGMELCNGYHELQNPVEQRMRLVEANQMRQMLGKDVLPIDEDFLKALEKGLPDSCGVAVGFDRLMMLRHHVTEISSVIPLVYER